MDLAAANVILDGLLGDGHAPGVPASFDLALFTGHPDDPASEELDTTGGYARIVVANTAAVWPAAADGSKVSEVLTLAGTGDYAAEAPYWRLYAGGVAYFTGMFEEAVSAATDTVELLVTLVENLEA